MTKLYVGNLPYSVNSQDLSGLFSQFGTVVSAVVIVDRQNNNRSKGFGFVEFDNESDAQEAMEKMNGAEVEGRTLKVNEAKPMQ